MSSMENQENFKEILLSDNHNDSEKLKAIQNLKNHFKPPDKVFSRLRLIPILRGAKISLESKTRDKNTLFSFGIALIKNIGKDSILNSEIFSHLEYVLARLNENDETLKNQLITKLWNKLDNGSIFQEDGIINASKQVIEKTVLDWLDNSDPQVEFLSKMASDSPKLFQMVSSIFYEVLVRTHCHVQILEVQKLFINNVKNICQEKGKNFLGLYPKGCGRLVALLMVPPQAFTDGDEKGLSDVISLLLEMFFMDRKKALILLSHYPDWISVLKNNL